MKQFVNIELNFVSVYAECCSKLQILSRHGWRNSCGKFIFIYPACKGVALLLRISYADWIAVCICVFAFIFTVTVSIQFNTIIINCPLSVEGLCTCWTLFDLSYCFAFASFVVKPAAKGVTGSLCRCGQSDSIRLYGITSCDNIIVTVYLILVIIGYAISFWVPLCSDCHILGRHCCRYFNIPTCEGVALLSGGSRCGYCRIVILSDRSNRCITRVCKSDCVLLNLPLCSDCYISCRHCFGKCRFPTIKGVTCLSGVSRCSYSCTKVLSDLIYLSAVSIHKSDCVLVDFPCCLKAHAINRHDCGNFCFVALCIYPTCKCITFLSGVSRYGYCRIVILSNSLNSTAAVGIKGNRVLIDCPLSSNRYISCRHCFGKCRFPAIKGVTFLSGVSRCSYSCTKVLSDRSNRCIACVFKGDRVLLNLPLCSDCYILGRHGWGNYLVPRNKGMTFLSGVSRCGYCRIVILSDRSNRCITRVCKSDCVLLNLPLCSDCYISCRHCFGKCRFPTIKGVTCLSGVSRCSYSCTKVLSDLIYLSAVSIHKSDCVLVDFPCCLKAHAINRHDCGNFCFVALCIYPTCKCITILGWVNRLGNCSAKISCNVCDFGAAVGIECNRVLVDLPLSCNRYIFSRHGCGEIIPALEGITNLSEVSRCSYSCAKVLSDLSYLSAVSIHKSDCVLVNSPNCFNCNIFSRHCCGNYRVPTCEGMTFLSGCFRCSYSCTKVLSDSLNSTATVSIKGNCVLLNRPNGIKSDIWSADSYCSSGFIINFSAILGCPAVKGIAIFSGWGSGYFSIICGINIVNSLTAVCYKGNGVGRGWRLKFSCICCIARNWHYSFIPTFKGVNILPISSLFGFTICIFIINRGTIVSNRNGIDFFSIAIYPSDFVFSHLFVKYGSIFNIACYLRNFRCPTFKCVSMLLCWVLGRLILVKCRHCTVMYFEVSL